ncbi:MAG: amino acid racemase [Sphaerochaetaceae bacterium]|nr:amino acid racemase [Sphaerochaetaceae bacterium]
MGGIGIVGGVGPLAGTDLAEKVFKNTKAHVDQDHIDLYLVSCPAEIPDRTDYVLFDGENPAPGIQKAMEKLALCGASAIGISCNTAHSPLILSQVKIPCGVNFINMIDQCCAYCAEKGFKKVGLLGTLGTLRSGIYADYFKNYPNLTLVLPSEKTQEAVQDTIYNKEDGIKALSAVSDRVREIITDAVMELAEEGCQAVILGCTELPLVFEEKDSLNGTVLIDPTNILARALIKATAPEKLI